MSERERETLGHAGSNRVNDKSAVEELTRERNFVLNVELEQVFIPSSRKFQTKGARLLKEIEPLPVFGRNGLKAIP